MAKTAKGAGRIRRGNVSPLTEQLCPGCGAGKGFRRLLVCASCWEKLPRELQHKAYNAAGEDRTKIAVGDVALEILVLLARLKSPPSNPAPAAKKQIRQAA